MDLYPDLFNASPQGNIQSTNYNPNAQWGLPQYCNWDMPEESDEN